MGGLAYSLRSLDTADVNFATVPFDWAGNVVVQNAEGDPLWESLRSDQPMVLPAEDRSEEHTSELQSRGHLVCRLLLEKKNKEKVRSNSSQIIEIKYR